MSLLALPDGILLNILNVVSEDSKETSHLSVVCKKFRFLSDHPSVQFKRHGTIVIRPPSPGRLPHYTDHNNHTFAILHRLSNHANERTRVPCVRVPCVHYHFVEVCDLKNFPLLGQERNIYTTRMMLKFGEYQLCRYNSVTKIDLSQLFQYPHLHAGEMNRFDPFDAGDIATILDDEVLEVENLTLAGTLLTKVFQSVTIIDLSATKWTQHATKSIHWTILETLIWNYTYCMDASLPDMNFALNLMELYVDNSTFLITGTDRNKMDHFSIPNIMDYPSVIFEGLQTCLQLRILSCKNCYLRDSAGHDIRLCGMTRGKFVVHIAPLSLRRLFGIIDDHYIEQVRERLPYLVVDWDFQHIEYV